MASFWRKLIGIGKKQKDPPKKDEQDALILGNELSGINSKDWTASPKNQKEVVPVTPMKLNPRSR